MRVLQTSSSALRSSVHFPLNRLKYFKRMQLYFSGGKSWLGLTTQFFYGNKMWQNRCLSQMVKITQSFSHLKTAAVREERFESAKPNFEKSFHPWMVSPLLSRQFVSLQLSLRRKREEREKENRPQHLLENWWCGIICSFLSSSSNS